MTKKLLPYIFIIFASSLFAQNYSNSWISFNQKYYKFPISKEGIYRIDRDYLVSVDAEFASINPKNLQIFDFLNKNVVMKKEMFMNTLF
jgi:hypothetical protein